MCQRVHNGLLGPEKLLTFACVYTACDFDLSFFLSALGKKCRLDTTEAAMKTISSMPWVLEQGQLSPP